MGGGYSKEDGGHRDCSLGWSNLFELISLDDVGGEGDVSKLRLGSSSRGLSLRSVSSRGSTRDSGGRNTVFYSSSSQSTCGTWRSDSQVLSPTAAMLLPVNSGRMPMEKYDIEEEPIGCGAFGTVQRARWRDNSSADPVALKSVLKGAIVNPDSFRTEVEVQLELDHPNICRLYEVFEDSQHVYLALEMCPGGELLDLLQAQPESRFRQDDAAGFIIQTLRAVSYMHSMRIAHRDIKLENLVVASGCDVPLSDTMVKLIDFGCSAHVPEFEKLKTVLGTATYVAPEVLRGRYNEKCDVWSCGVMLYIMLSGTCPFDGETDEDIFAQVARGRLDFRDPCWSEVAPVAVDLIRRMCHRSPSCRVPACEALQDPWLKKHVHHDSVVLAKRDAARLFNFSQVENFKQKAIFHIARHVGDKAVETLREAFMQLDTDGNGVLDLEEIKSCWEQAGMGTLPDDFEQQFNAIDLQGNGHIDYTEFLAACIDKQVYLQESYCREAFAVFDRSGTGKLSYDDLVAVMESEEVVGANCREDVRSVLALNDADGDGEISFEEFMAMLRRERAASDF